MKIYTKTGDAGQSSLLGGQRVYKSDPRLEAYGTIDELNAWIGLLKEQEGMETYRDLLTRIQEALFTLGSHLAAENAKQVQAWKLPAISVELVPALELEMDRMDAELPPLRNFILAGGHPVSAMCQVVRTVCRRAERQAVALTEALPEEGDRLAPVIITLNRLSDYFFVLARDILRARGCEATLWNPARGT